MSRRSAPTWCSIGCARLYGQQGTPQRFEEQCRRLIAARPQDWRARLALGPHLARRGQPVKAFEPLIDALERNPHGLTVHEAIWDVLLQLGLDRALVQRYVEARSRRGVLPRSARLPEVSLPQHRAAVAVPALSRVEHVRRRAHRAGQANRRRALTEP